MNRKLTAALAAAFLVFGGAYYLWAQMGGMGGGRQGGQMGGMQRPGMMQGGVGGGSALAVHGNFIYVFTGGTLSKVDPAKMEVVKELEFRPKMRAAGLRGQGMPQGQGMPGGEMEDDAE